MATKQTFWAGYCTYHLILPAIPRDHHMDNVVSNINRLITQMKENFRGCTYWSLHPQELTSLLWLARPHAS